jgi:hypothetical protein
MSVADAPAGIHGIPSVPLNVVADLAALMARPGSTPAPAPPPPPLKWQVESENLKPESNRKTSALISTPPKAPLLERMPLSPTAVNLLPAGLLSPGS